MTGYRCYFLNDQNHIQYAENIEVERLEEAIERAGAMIAKLPLCRSIEIWQGALRLYASRDPVPRHQCHIYEGAPSDSLPMMAVIIERRLKENLHCLYLNSPPMVAGLKLYLTAAGNDVEQQIAKGALTLSSDQEHLAGGQFDAARMLRMLEQAIDQAVSDGYAGLWAAGDMTWEVGAQCGRDELLDYEWRLEEIFRRRSELSGICQYHAGTLPRDLVTYGLAAHRSIFVSETLSRLNPYYLAPFSKDAPHERLGDFVDELCATGPHRT